MNRVYKSLISITIIISMLAMSGIAVASARPAPYPTPTSTSEQIQDQRLTNLEINDTNQAINNTEQQLSIDNLKASLANSISDIIRHIADLTIRITNIENDPYPKVYSVDFNFGEPAVFIWPPNLANEIKTLNISLPRDSIVHIEGTGFIAGWKNFSEVQLGYDTNNPTLAYTITKDNSNNTMTSGFSVSRTIFLPAGNHTIYLVAALGGYGQHEDDAYATAQSELSATAYDTNKGEIQSSQ